MCQDYKIPGLELISHSKPDEPALRGCESLGYETPSGASFVVAKDGTQNIATLHLESKKITYLTKFKNGEQIFNPRWSPNGKAVVFSISRRDNRDLAYILINNKKMKYLLKDEADAAKRELDAMNKRIEELQSESSES